MLRREFVAEKPLSLSEAIAMFAGPLTKTPLVLPNDEDGCWAFLGSVRRKDIGGVIRAIQSTGIRARQCGDYNLEAFRNGGLVSNLDEERVGVCIEERRFFSFIADTLHL